MSNNRTANEADFSPLYFKVDECTGPFVCFTVTEGGIPQRSSEEFDTLQAAEEWANGACSEDVTCYVFDRSRGLEGKTRSLAYACSHTWSVALYSYLLGDESVYCLDGYIKNHKGSHISWRGVRIQNEDVGEPIGTEFPIDDLDFLEKDGPKVDVSPIEQQFQEYCKKLKIDLINAVPDANSPADIQKQAEEFKQAYLYTLMRVAHSLPHQFMLDTDHIPSPAWWFKRSVAWGEWNKVPVKEYDRVFSNVEPLDNLWNGNSRISLGELAWKVLAASNYGLDLAKALQEVYDPQFVLDGASQLDARSIHQNTIKTEEEHHDC